MKVSREELEERIAKALQTMSGEELTNLYNKEFGEGMKYVGCGKFEQQVNDPESVVV